MNTDITNALIQHRFQDYLTLCKPRVILVMLITTWVGMLLSTHTAVPIHIFIFATLGIAFSGGSAAVINHLVDRHIDAKMSRTEHRPIASKRISVYESVVFASMLGISGLVILSVYVNLLTAFLTLLTVFGYAVLYTFFLKHRTPQNIVIGGAAGAMPPLLGWTAVTGTLSAFPWLLVLIIFAWTPPHFWALAIYRKEDYQNANIPMLPNTHGIPFTKLCLVLYTVLLWVISLLPYVIQMSGILYLISAMILGATFLGQSIILYFSEGAHLRRVALKTFSFSILYLLLLFSALLIDHYT